MSVSALELACVTWLRMASGLGSVNASYIAGTGTITLTTAAATSLRNYVGATGQFAIGSETATYSSINTGTGVVTLLTPLSSNYSVGQTVSVFGDTIGYTQKDCDVVGPSGKPHPRCGRVFVGIHAYSQSGLQDGCSEEEYGVNVTVSRRLNEPFDRIGQDTKNNATVGINALCDAIKAYMLKNQYQIMNTANTTIGDDANGFVEPLFFLDGDAGGIEVTADWFNGDSHAAEYGLDNTGMDTARLKRSMRFGRALRIQSLESVT